MPAEPISTAVVLGGASDIAPATVRRLAAGGLVQVVLACRRPDELAARLAAEPAMDVEVELVPWDALDTEGHEAFFERCAAWLGRIDLVLCAVGSLGHGAGLPATPATAGALITDNLTGPATALTAAAHHLAGQARGTIVVLSSVAGLRARKSNYLYGAAKAGLDAFTAGLSDALAGSGVAVVLVRPGFVHSKMTTGLQPAPFATEPDAVATAIVGALASGRSRTVHVPRQLGPLFAALRLAPRPLWRRIAGDR